VEEISADLAAEFGVNAQHSKMDNGELRYRLVAKDGSAYVRTEASAAGGWQNSHFHKSVLETYILQQGWGAFAELHGDVLRLWIMHPGDVHTTSLSVPHNMYLTGHAVTHVVKHGGNGETRDWFADPALDAMTKHLSEADILGWR
jgi:hypothetical protein